MFCSTTPVNIIASARNTRDGNRPPVKQILYQFEDSRTYFLTINWRQGLIGRRGLDIYIHQTSNLELADPNGSLATPGDAHGLLTVGAVYWRGNRDELEPFASRVITADGRDQARCSRAAWRAQRHLRA